MKTEPDPKPENTRRDVLRVLFMYVSMFRFKLYLHCRIISARCGISIEDRSRDAARILCGLWMIPQTWLRRGFKESPEHIAEIYARASSILNNGV